jgi:hypothetical protein
VSCTESGCLGGAHRPAGGCPAVATPCAALLGCAAAHVAQQPRLLPARPAPIAAPPAAACAAQQAAERTECADVFPADRLPVTGAAGLLRGHSAALNDWPGAECKTRPSRPQLPVLEPLQTLHLQRQKRAGWVSVASSGTLRPRHRLPTAARTPAASAAAVRPAASAAAAAAVAAPRSCQPVGLAALVEAPCSAAQERRSGCAGQQHVGSGCPAAGLTITVAFASSRSRVVQ